MPHFLQIQPSFDVRSRKGAIGLTKQQPQNGPESRLQGGISRSLSRTGTKKGGTVSLRVNAQGRMGLLVSRRTVRTGRQAILWAGSFQDGPSPHR